MKTGLILAENRLTEAKNNAERQPVLNLQIAKAYLAGSDNGITTRTWQHAIEALTNTKQDANKERWLRVAGHRCMRTIRKSNLAALARFPSTGGTQESLAMRLKGSR